MRLDRLLVATTNAGKLIEIRAALAGSPCALLTLQDLPPIDAPPETGRTFAENARLKAVYYAAVTGMTTVAEDSGLEIDALEGRPGVESARYGGPDLPYPEKFTRLYAELEQASGAESRARFVCALAVAEGPAVVFEASGTLEGRIAARPSGSGGFGYDPIFFYPPFGCTLADAGDRKRLVSHRSQAFEALKRHLERRARFD